MTGEADKDTMFLSKILTRSCIMIHYIVEENICVVIVYKFLEQQKNWNILLKIDLKLMANKELKLQKARNDPDA